MEDEQTKKSGLLYWISLDLSVLYLKGHLLIMQCLYT